MNKYQAAIIGLGKTGKTSAITLAKAGWRVIFVEQSNAMYGGTCINAGCTPTKTLVHDAQQYTDLVCVIQRRNEVVNFLRNKNFHNLADMPNTDVTNGQAEFINNRSLRACRPGGNLEIHGEKIFINIGAQTVVPPIPRITTTPSVYGSTGLFSLKELPGHLGILSGGYIGAEFASTFADSGSKVIISETASLFLPQEDRDIADNIATILRGQGVDMVLNTRVEWISHHESQVQVRSEHAQLAVDALLITSGRQPVTASLYPENAGIAVNECGAIVTDKQLHAAADNIWTMGDATDGLQFTYTSLDGYRTVRNELLGKGRRSTDDRKSVSYSVFMIPPPSRVGTTEEQARKSDTDTQVMTLLVAIIPRAKVMNNTRGVLKAIVDSKIQRILGASLLCVDSRRMTNIVEMAMSAGPPYSILRDQIFTRPSTSKSPGDLFSLVK